MVSKRLQSVGLPFLRAPSNIKVLSQGKISLVFFIFKHYQSLRLPTFTKFVGFLVALAHCLNTRHDVHLASVSVGTSK